MPYLNFADIKAGDTVTTVVRVFNIEQQTTAANKTTYCNITITDAANGKEVAKMWQTRKDDLPFKEEDMIGVSLECQLYNGAKSYIIKKAYAAPNDVNPNDYLPHPPLPPEEMYGDILRNNRLVSKQVPQGALLSMADLVEGIYEEHKEKLLYWSAAKSMHHSMYGGLIYHTFRMVRNGLCATKVYKLLDPEVLLAGIALHDIGKLTELDTNKLGIAEYTVEGNLYGHLFLGLNLVDDYVRRQTEKFGTCPYNKAQLDGVRHIIASHHGKQEWGAITEPHTPEAQVAFLVDYMDAKIFMYEDALKSVPEGEMMNVFNLGYVYHSPKS